MRSLKTVIITSTLALGLVAPATAHADRVDDLLRAVPEGQISCEQASRYWTNEQDFNNKRAQALALATFDPRGPQIRSALARIDEAADRCGLRGTTNTNPAPAPAPAPSNPAPGNNTPANPAPNPVAPVSPAATPVLSSQQLPANIANMRITVPGVGSVTIAELIALVNAFLAQWNARL